MLSVEEGANGDFLNGLPGLSRMATHARYGPEPEATELRKSLPPVLESLLELMALEPDLADEARRYRALYGWLLSDDDRGRGP